jgi:hypothetical protein
MSFASIISIEDRRRLRHIVRKVHLSHYPTDKLTDIECDRLIDAWGPETAASIVRKAVDAGQIA